MAEGPPEVLDCSTDAAATNSLLGLRIAAIFAVLAISRWAGLPPLHMTVRMLCSF